MTISTKGMMGIVQAMPSPITRDLPPLSRTHTASEHLRCSLSLIAEAIIAMRN